MSSPPQLHGAEPRITRKHGVVLNWVAVQELELRQNNPETMLLSVYVYIYISIVSHTMHTWQITWFLDDGSLN